MLLEKLFSKDADDDHDDVAQHLGLSCDGKKHYSTLMEVCSGWLIQPISLHCMIQNFHHFFDIFGGVDVKKV